MKTAIIYLCLVGFIVSQYDEEAYMEPEYMDLGQFKIISEPTGDELTQWLGDRTSIFLYPGNGVNDTVWNLRQTVEGDLIMENNYWGDWLELDESYPTEVLGSPIKEESLYSLWTFENIAVGKYLITNKYSKGFLTQDSTDASKVYLQYDRNLATVWTTATNIV